MKKKICLVGKHSHRTPLSYNCYRSYFEKIYQYTQNINLADYIVVGFVIDIGENFETIYESVSSNKNTKLIVLSEEPLWDTVWSGEYTQKFRRYMMNGKELNFTFLNHLTSTIFDFDKVPYFITTSNDFVVRYHALFTLNKIKSIKELKINLEKAAVEAAFYAEKRIDKRFEFHNVKNNVTGLSGFRTRLATEFKGRNIKIVGANWEESRKRQSLPDWHLDKICCLFEQCKFISALENTHQKNYVTEKIYDAFASFSIPIYYASAEHAIYKIVPEGSFVNLYNKTVEQAVLELQSFEVTDTFLNKYSEALRTLSAVFCDYRLISLERQRVVSAVVSEFEAI